MEGKKDELFLIQKLENVPNKLYQNSTLSSYHRFVLRKILFRSCSLQNKELWIYVNYFNNCYQHNIPKRDHEGKEEKTYQKAQRSVQC